MAKQNSTTMRKPAHNKGKQKTANAVRRPAAQKLKRRPDAVLSPEMIEDRRREEDEYWRRRMEHDLKKAEELKQALKQAQTQLPRIHTPLLPSLLLHSGTSASSHLRKKGGLSSTSAEVEDFSGREEVKEGPLNPQADFEAKDEEIYAKGGARRVSGRLLKRRGPAKDKSM